MLLSEDGRDTFLCDFGHAERLDNQGQSLSGSKGEHRAITAIKLSVMGKSIRLRGLNCFPDVIQYRAERLGDPHGPRDRERGTPRSQSRCVEQLLYVSAHGQWLSTVDKILHL